jgi:DNA-binding transcriptional ArsR family regulator
MPFHRGSLFTPGPRHPLSTDQRRAWLARIELERRAGRLTPAFADIARTLLRHLSEGGQCDPCQRRLAEQSGYSERTVRRALAALRDLGLLDWQRRLIRDRRGTRQTSNAYRLSTPATPPAAPALRPITPKVQYRMGSTARLSAGPAPAFDPAARKALERIAAARAARFGQEWAARRM